MRNSTAIELAEEERERLESKAKSRTLAARLVQRAQTVLMGAKGLTLENSDIHGYIVDVFPRGGAMHQSRPRSFSPTAGSFM